MLPEKLECQQLTFARHEHESFLEQQRRRQQVRIPLGEETFVKFEIILQFLGKQFDEKLKCDEKKLNYS